MAGVATIGNLLADLPAPAPEEVLTPLVEGRAVRIERIVSTGQSSPAGFWYDQPWDEFVLLVTGAAAVEIEGAPPRSLTPGEWMVLPAHVRHRVAWTAAGQATVWLAVHTPPAGS